jgi:CheY-like chemotaxis protein
MIKPRILLVEDDSLILKAMTLQFTSAGFLVKSTKDGGRALQILSTWIPTAIILDILMPKVNGYTLLSKIKADPRLKGIPVLIASNLSSEQDLAKGYGLSAAEFIVKSDLDLKDLVSKTNYYIKMSDHGRSTLNLS